MERREFLKSIGLGVAVCTMPGDLFAGGSRKRPNILVIHVDQHRMDCIGAYGNRDVKTPHIDSLATEGVMYKNSFCAYPVCTPSRYSLLSGLYVNEHRGWSNQSTLSPEIATFPRILRSAGYRTKAVGKMHFLPTYLDVGFDEMELSEQNGPGRWDDDYHRYLMRNGVVDRNDMEDQLVREYRKNSPQEYWDTCGALVSNLPEKHHSTTWVADRALETIEKWDGKQPGLLMVGFIKPHHPFDPPSPWHEMYEPDELTVMDGWTDECFEHDLAFSRGYFPNDELTEGKLRRVMAYYYATISQIDHHVGRMVRLLKAKGLYDNTLVVYTADHGDFMGFHHMLLKGNYMYDPLVKVPLIIKWPYSKRKGEVNVQLVNNIDLAPALCTSAKCKPGNGMHGENLNSKEAGHELIFSEYGRGREVMARSQRYKLILAPANKKNLFFDLKNDPLEMKNLYADPAYRKEVRRMEGALTGWRSKESNPKPFVNQNAPQIHRANVPSADLSHRMGIIEYYRKDYVLVVRSPMVSPVHWITMRTRPTYFERVRARPQTSITSGSRECLSIIRMVRRTFST